MSTDWMAAAIIGVSTDIDHEGRVLVHPGDALGAVLPELVRLVVSARLCATEGTITDLVRVVRPAVSSEDVTAALTSLLEDGLVKCELIGGCQPMYVPV